MGLGKIWEEGRAGIREDLGGGKIWEEGRSGRREDLGLGKILEEGRSGRREDLGGGKIEIGRRLIGSGYTMLSLTPSVPHHVGLLDICPLIFESSL